MVEYLGNYFGWELVLNFEIMVFMKKIYDEVLGYEV